MGKRTFVPFDVFSMQVDVPVSTLVRDGDLGWTCGQCPLDQEARVLSPGNLIAQAVHVCDMIESVLRRGDFDGASIAKMNVYFSETETGDRDRIVRVFRDRFTDTPVVVPISPSASHGQRWQIDWFSASSTKEVVIEVETRQPTIFRAKTSMTKAT